jgi:hypothetical protein
MTNVNATGFIFSGSTINFISTMRIRKMMQLITRCGRPVSSFTQLTGKKSTTEKDVVSASETETHTND